MQQDSQRFSVAVRYWPARTAMYWWEHFDRVEMTRELDAAADLKVGDLAISLTWNDFQPEPARVSVPAMRHLETVLDAAADRDLRLVITLIPVSTGSYVWLPGWALSLEEQSAGPVLAGNSQTWRRPFNLFEDERMVQAQIDQILEVLTAFRDHPAVFSWVLGAGMTLASPPSSRLAFAGWLNRLGEAAARSGARQELRHSVSARAVVCCGQIDFKAASTMNVQVQVEDDWRPPWLTVSSPERASFLASYVTRLVGAGVYLTGLGRCTARGVESCVAPEAAADEADKTVQAARASGAAGCEAASLFDYAPELERAIPFRRDQGLLSRGLLTTVGVQKPSAEAWRRWHRRAESVLPAPEDVPPPDDERRERDPEGTARAYFEDMYR